jgi:hypothetical protein
MARNMIDANIALFRHLEGHCARRGEPIPSAGAVRWVQGDETAQDWLKHLQLRMRLRFGRRRSLTWLSYNGADLVCLVGFEFEPTLAQIQPCATNAGVSVCILSELQPLPLATPAQIRNVVEVGSQDEPGYAGHDCAALEALFPELRLFETPHRLNEEAVSRLFLMVSIHECRNGESWIDETLADDLATLADLNVSHFPYDALCRSIFDWDPRSLYMALYRCLEATYAYESCRKLVTSLNLAQDWHELAAALDTEVGWHPQQAASLNLVLQYALEDDLQAVCDCLGAVDDTDLRTRAGRAIYRLRNRIVHYDPQASSHALGDGDWNELCRRMVGIVLHVFAQAFAASH